MKQGTGDRNGSLHELVDLCYLAKPSFRTMPETNAELSQIDQFKTRNTMKLLVQCLGVMVWLPFSLFGQYQAGPLLSFRQHNATDTNSVFLESDPRPLSTGSDSTYSITLIVTDIRNTKGVIRFKFYDDNSPFPHDTGFLRIVVDKSRIKNNTFTATYHGFSSRYMGIALHDDENGDMELDFGWIFPKEGHAFSDYYHKAMRRPTYHDFRFLLTGSRQVVMKMRYY